MSRWTRRKSREVFHEWLALTRPGPNAEGWRRPEFMMRPVKPEAARVQGEAERWRPATS